MILTRDGKIPVHWWNHVKNFGDLLSPWLVNKISGKDVVFVEQYERNYTTIGSIIGHATKNSIIWGTGAFGLERVRDASFSGRKMFDPDAKYLAVRGPLTRNLLEVNGIKCPRIYGDPALLVSRYHKINANRDVQYEAGLVLRWSERGRIKGDLDDRVKLIFLDTDDVEATLDAIASCKRAITTSLHGLIVSDSYGIPNAWIDSDTPTGLEFKYWDYLISVGKVRKPSLMSLEGVHLHSLEDLLGMLDFDGRDIDIDLNLLESVCPFLPSDDGCEIAHPAAIRRKWLFFGRKVLSN